MRVLHVTDTHLTAARDPDAGDDAVARLVAALDGIVPVDVVVHTGDITEDFSLEGTRRVAELLAPLAPHVVAVPGNHDRPSVVAQIFPITDVDVDGWRILGVSSVVEDEIDGTIDAGHVAELIDERSDRPNTLLAIHHPLRSNSTHPWFQLHGADELLAVVAARPQVRAVISGHTHEPLDVTVDGVRLISGPSTWYPITHHGETWIKGQGRTGVQLLDLGGDGSVTVIDR